MAPIIMHSKSELSPSRLASAVPRNTAQMTSVSRLARDLKKRRQNVSAKPIAAPSSIAPAISIRGASIMEA